MLEPMRTVQLMQTNQEERTRKQLQSMSPPDRGRPQQQETSNQANSAFENRGSPMIGGKTLRTASLHVVNDCQNQGDKRKGRINPTVRTSYTIDHSHQEEQQRSSLPRHAGQVESCYWLREKQHFTDGRKREAKPSRKPEAEIASLLIAPEKGKKHQQNDEGAGFKEGYSEQALVFQHDTQPPGQACRPCGVRAAKNSEDTARSLEWRPALTLTCYFPTGQGAAK